MSQNVPKSKENGVKGEKSPSKHACPPGPHAHPHEAGDNGSEAEDVTPIPENIFKRVNALKNIHMDVQKFEQEMYTKLFLLEAEQHRKMAALLQKRAEIINGKYEPTGEETQFQLKADEEKQETTTSTETAGIPDFWLTILSASMQTAQSLNEEDVEVLRHLVDVRSVYSEKPLGFTLEFEFKENPYFTNKVLSRSYEFGTDVDREELYVSSGLAPKITSGSGIDWKAGKDNSKKETVTFQRNKKTGERRQIKKVEDVDTFFQFFTPKVTDLTSLSKPVPDNDEAAADELAEKAEQAEVDFELASYIRTRMIPRAVLIYTGEDEDDDGSYGGEDYDDEDEEDDDDDDEEGGPESDDSDSSGDAAKKPTGPGGKGGKVSKGVARR